MASDNTTLCVYKSYKRKPVEPEKKRSLANVCGVNFIKLRWKKLLNTNIGISGFQHVKLVIAQNAQNINVPTAEWHLNPHTHQPMAEGAADFVPDEMGVGWAYLPDSPFNRVRLAYAELHKNALWDIADEKIKAEIADLAAEIGSSVEHAREMADLEDRKARTQMRVEQSNVKMGIETKSPIEIENAVLERKVAEMEAKKKQKELKEKIANIQREIGMESTVQKQESKGGINEDKPVATALPKDKKVIRKQAKSDVYANIPDLIQSIKEERKEKTGRTQGWAFTERYKKEVQPMVDARMKEIIDEHTNSGVMD